jgi:hypothetical protein
MTTRRSCGRRALAAWAGMSLALALGCGDETGLEKRYPVSGTVTYHDEPVKDGQIHFLPKTVGGRSATGVIEDGQYSLTTMVPNDGAVPGKYQVTIVSKDIDFTKVKETIAKKGGIGRHKDIIKAASSAKSLIPTKYGSVQSSGLMAEVQPHSNTFNYKLTD